MELVTFATRVCRVMDVKTMIGESDCAVMSCQACVLSEQ